MKIERSFKFVFIVTHILLSISCHGQHDGNREMVLQNTGIERSGQVEVTPPNKSHFTKADAFVAFDYNEENMQKQKGLIRIYDESGDLWYEVDYYWEQRPESTNIGGKFRPFIYRQGDFWLTFRCTRVSTDWYEVIVNEDTSPKIKKYVRSSDVLLRFLTAEKYVLELYSIVFESKKNPVRTAPNGTTVDIEYSDEMRFIPAEVRGDWLRLRWQPRSPDESNSRIKTSTVEQSGWIRWRRDNQILIHEFYP